MTRHDSLAPCLQKKIGLHQMVRTPRIPADFWVEHKEAYRGKGLSSGLLVILVSNRQGPEELQQPAHMDPALVDYCQPAIEDFLQGGLPGHLSARHTGRFRHSQDIPELQKTICFCNLR